MRSSVIRRKHGGIRGTKLAPLALALLGAGLPVAGAFAAERETPGDLTWSEIGATLGAGGHFIQHRPRVHLNNPKGQPFEVELFFFVKGWRKNEGARRERILLTDPNGEPVVSGMRKLDGNRVKLEIEDAVPGVYTLEPGRRADGGFAGRPRDYWLQTTLDQAVVESGAPDGHAIRENRWLLVQPTVPLRWWFWVPEGTTEFDVVTQKAHSYSSQREDGAVRVYSPRGQLMDAVIGQIPRSEHTADNVPWNKSRTIEVEPGASGRFWSLEVALAGAHHRCNIAVTIDGVPRVLANAPEAWFDPETGKRPDVPLYDDDPFMQAAPEKGSAFWDDWPGGLSIRGGIRHWSPVPSVGDPDGSRIRGDATLAFWNPKERPLRFELGAYLPRIGPERAAEEKRARVTVRSAEGDLLHREAQAVPHHAGNPTRMPALARELAYVDVEGIGPGLDRWYAYTYPAVPTVLVGEDAADDWHRFRLEVANTRHWYFFVPEGTRQLELRYDTRKPRDRLELRVHSPVSTAELAYGRSGELTVRVPPGTDGKMWHLRLAVGGGTRMPRASLTGERDNLGIDVDLRLRGVPPYLAPSWEQWFNPESPRRPFERGAR